jgi:hypothetical protein
VSYPLHCGFEMIICFSCTPETKALLDGLVATGDYPDHSAVLVAAVANLSVLHSEMTGGSVLVIGGDPTSSPIGDVSFPGEQKVAAATASPAAPASRKSDMHARFQLPTVIQKPTAFASVKAETMPAKKTMPLNEWLFGQFNRLLPAKVTCRALVNIAAQGGDLLNLEETAIEIANAAAQFGRHLAALDQQQNLGRDDALAVAFPDVAQIKSIQRFANQFVGSMNKEDQLLGLPAALKLIGTDPGRVDRIVLTEAGWTFGSMRNPLLDGIPARSVERFTEAEVFFLVDHIRANVPAEAIAYRTVLLQIARGVVTPDSLDDALAALPGQPREFGRPFVSTQRSGVICRMADLGLIARSRTATRVTYVLLPRGEEFLASMGGA